MITDIYAPLTTEQITEGAYDQRAALIDLEATRIAEEEGLSYIQALATVGQRYNSIELLPDNSSYDNVVSVGQFTGEDSFESDEDDDE